MKRSRRLLGALILAGLSCCLGSAHALTIVIVPDAGLSANQAALDAFNRAAAEWSSVLTDPITVTINAGLDNLGSATIIGQTTPVTLGYNYATLRDQLALDSVGKPNRAADAALPATFNATLPAGFTLSSTVAGTKADLKAMGFTGLDAAFGASDASITFNSTFNFSYTTGPAAGKIDFQSVAAHEIGHALGFFSAVDTVDQTNSGTINPAVLDLFRFAAASAPGNLLAFTAATRDLQPGNADVTSNGAISLAMSTGFYKGDGRQASHWKDNDLTGQLIGIMDPTLASGTQVFVNNNDLLAMQLIGYDLIPEPGAWTATLGGVGALAIALRRRSRSVA